MTVGPSTGGAPLPGVADLTVVDVVRPATTADAVPGPEDARLIAELQAVHLRHFADYPHVATEIAHDWTAGTGDPEVIVHQFLLQRDGVAVGEYLIHVNLRRGIVLRHFLALDRSARSGLPLDWVRHLVDHVVAVATADAARAGRPLLAMCSEVQPQHLAGWERLGYRPLHVGYAEPAHGKGWSAYGPPRFLPITPVVRALPDGLDRPLAELAGAGLRAFLLDHYRLPPDDPTVAAILARADALA